jgi:hypothetical protein
MRRRRLLLMGRANVYVISIDRSTQMGCLRRL